jgi:hypothetical protein
VNRERSGENRKEARDDACWETMDAMNGLTSMVKEMGVLCGTDMSRLTHGSLPLEMGRYIDIAIAIKMGWELTSLPQNGEARL